MPDVTTERIHAYIHAHYAATPHRLLYLAQLGSWLAKSEIRRPQGTRIADWLDGHLGNEFAIVVDPANSVRQAIVPSELADSARELFRSSRQTIVPPGLAVSARESFREDPAHVALRRLPRSVLLAFVKHLEPGERMFLEDHFPFKYKIEAQAPGSDWLEVQPEFRIEQILGKTASLSPSDANALDNNIRHWCEANGISMEELTAEPPQNALQRLIMAQPSSFRDRFLIPMDIADILLRHK